MARQISPFHGLRLEITTTKTQKEKTTVMGDRTFNVRAFTSVKESVKSEGGSTTHRGEQRHKEGKGLDPLVDPKGYGAIRRSISRVEKKDEGFVLLVGPAILKETRFDTTGSMGDNVQLAFDVLPKSYHLLKEVEGAPLARYDLQIINSIFGDVCDDYVLCRSQAEMEEKIAEQLRLMVPEGAGGDADEDPQYGLFGAAYLTAADIANRWELKSYDFTVTDARGRSRLDPSTLIRVFGNDVFDHVKENGYQIKKDDLPTTKEVVRDLLKISHAFLIQIEDDDPAVNRFWTDIYGKDRVIVIPNVSYLPEVEAVIIGLTEGTLDLQSVESFLIDQAEISKSEAAFIKKAVANIPLGAQAILPNFDKLPKKGDVFAKKDDSWPIGKLSDDKKKPAKAPGKKPGVWL